MYVHFNFLEDEMRNQRKQEKGKQCSDLTTHRLKRVSAVSSWVYTGSERWVAMVTTSTSEPEAPKYTVGLFPISISYVCRENRIIKAWLTMCHKYTLSYICHLKSLRLHT
jgi:hypothetical protein